MHDNPVAEEGERGEPSDSGSFVRWQTNTVKQLGNANNLVFGLATGLLAFQVNLLLGHHLFGVCPRGFGIAAVLFLGISIGFALGCTLNRLADFRLTAAIARRREKQLGGLSTRRKLAKDLGKRTWELFVTQLLSFGVGAAASTIAVLWQLMEFG